MRRSTKKDETSVSSVLGTVRSLGDLLILCLDPCVHCAFLPNVLRSRSEIVAPRNVTATPVRNIGL